MYFLRIMITAAIISTLTTIVHTSILIHELADALSPREDDDE